MKRVECASTAPNRQMVSVNHLGAAGKAQDRQNIGRGAALDLLGVGGVVGNEAAADLGAVWPADDHRVTARKVAVDSDDACRQEAAAALERSHRTGVDGQR